MENKRLGGNFTFEPKAQHPSASHSSETPPGNPDRSATDQTVDRTADRSANSNDVDRRASTNPELSPYLQFLPTSPQCSSPVQLNSPAAPARLAAPASLLFSSRFAPVRMSSVSA